MTVLLLATRNEHKVRELADILQVAQAQGSLPTSVEVVGLDADSGRGVGAAPQVAETGVTFTENALLKARSACSATGLPAVADDSGLCVDVMGGAPGIFSARWSGRHGDDRANVELLLSQLDDVPDQHRTAHFSCAAALVTPDGTEQVTSGRLEGLLTRHPEGDGGFGYDPILLLPRWGVTVATLDPHVKNRISHRGQAMRALTPHLSRWLATRPG